MLSTVSCVDSNVADLVATIERADGPAHERTARYIDELLATGVTKALAAATGNDHGTYGRHYAFPCLVPFMRYSESARMGNQGKLVQMQLEQLAGSSMDTEYDLMIRDYASDSSEANAEKIRAELSRMTPKDL